MGHEIYARIIVGEKAVLLEVCGNCIHAYTSTVCRSTESSNFLSTLNCSYSGSLITS